MRVQARGSRSATSIVSALCRLARHRGPLTDSGASRCLLITPQCHQHGGFVWSISSLPQVGSDSWAEILYKTPQRVWPPGLHLGHALSGSRKQPAVTSHLVIAKQLGAQLSPETSNAHPAKEWPPVAVFRAFSSIRTPVYAVGDWHRGVHCLVRSWPSCRHGSCE
jgi:hypothetical protein